MSRLPLKVKPQETPQPPEFVLLLDTMSKAPITCSQIQTWTRQDPVLASVLRYTQLGWLPVLGSLLFKSNLLQLHITSTKK